VTAKRYDRAYFDKWYRSRRHAIGSRTDLAREVAFAVAATEVFLARPLRSVLDVGAGEGRWQPALHRIRPGVRYAGVDSSEWAVAQWGRRRNLRHAEIDALDQAGLSGPFDLVVVADVLHYVPTPTLRRAATQLAALIGGLAYMPTFTTTDASAGDHVGFQRRTAPTYRRILGEAGIRPIGMHLWTTDDRFPQLSELERAST